MLIKNTQILRGGIRDEKMLSNYLQMTNVRVRTQGQIEIYY